MSTETAPDHSAHGYVDPYSYPGLPLVHRLMLAANPDMSPDDLQGFGEGDGCYDEIRGLLADHNWHTDLAIANTIGIVGDWGTDDVSEAVTYALNGYRALLLARDERDSLRATVAVMRMHLDEKPDATLRAAMNRSNT